MPPLRTGARVIGTLAGDVRALIEPLPRARADPRLSQAGSDARVLVLTTFDLDEYVYEAMRPVRAGSLVQP